MPTIKGPVHIRAGKELPDNVKEGILQTNAIPFKAKPKGMKKGGRK